MRLHDTITISFASLVRNKRRAVLTMLGIVIGVGSVILMLSVGQAAERFILSQVASFGSDIVFIRNGSGDTKSGPPSPLVKQSLTRADFERIRQLAWVRAAAAEVMSLQLVESPTASMHEQITGASEAAITIFNAELADGAFIMSDEVDTKARVAVLGHDIAKDLFGEENPVGKTIKIQKKTYRVVGTLKPAGTRLFTNLDRAVYVPYTALMEQLNMEHVLFIAVKVGDVPPAQAKERFQIILRETHKLDNPEGDLSKDDFFVASQEDVAQRAGMIGTILSVLLSAIASISLIVGGVGIMNIMYVTVTERTREIGLRKAIGARPRDILRQFLYEAIFLTIIAGLVGIFFGLLLSWIGLRVLAGYQQGWSFAVPWGAVAYGFGVSALIGIVFGYFPARRAAHLNPIEALRYE